MNKNYRIHTNISQDQVLNVNMRQDFDFLEVLSLTLSQEDAYRLHSSSYGVIVGRVLANDAFGIPNAKVSVFIERDTTDETAIANLYPYATTSSKDKDGRRYNLLPNYSDDECYRVVGTFPSKTLVLDDNTYLEVFDKYYRYTTVTNQSGDYMIFGVPTGNNEVHVDIDLSDIGILSQKPRDFEYKGYNINLFDNANQFKESTSLDGLAQIISQNKTINVYPFWCDESEGDAAITRCDIEVQYKFEPTCVFMGSIMTDNGSNTIGHDCRPAKKAGLNNQLVTGEGTIEMIRKTTDGLVEEFQIQGNQLIDSDGVWCYQIPMNLDFIGTDEYGNIVPTDNPSKGIPTRTQVRFRISKNEAPGGSSFHTAKILVPMNPQFDEGKVIPTIDVDGNDIERMYEFGSSTPQGCFRDLYWNNVYSVKSYIPRLQNRVRIPISDYSALKGANLADDQNQIPFNKLRVDVPFTYMIVCILFTIVMWIVIFVNTLICGIDAIFKILFKITDISILGIRPFKWIRDLLGLDYIGCLPLSAGMNDGNVAYYPGCTCSSTGLRKASCPSDFEGKCEKSSDRKSLEDQVQRNLALEYDIIKLDFYNDWLNGALYMPLWYWKKSMKKKFLFFTIKSAQDTFCNCNKTYKRLRNAMSCTIEYTNEDMGIDSASVREGEKKWHKRGAAVVFKHGLIKEVKNKDDLSVYYYSAVDATDDASDPDMQMSERVGSFPAVRLYATDIILLGNLNEDNMYGLPQFFRELPSTTANIPPIATTEEVEDEDDGYNQTSDMASDDEEEQEEGSITTTGMDWGYNGGRMSPNYKSGLFMDLSCTYVNTKAKSCINAERLSEYGMNLDMTYSMPYANAGSNDVKYGDILTDGFVNKLEMDSLDGRAEFATMNHVGFIPNGLTQTITQIPDENTNYLIPKMRYLYPVNLDGRLDLIMQNYKNGFEQSLTDDKDEAYLAFRFGSAAPGGTDADGRSRHYYVDRSHFGASGQRYSMPLYNNSYYFFFGINKGNTAIDKFNKLFDAQCFQNKKIPFTMLIDKQSEGYCTSSYKGDDIDMAYPYIRVGFEDIQKTYSYVLYNANGVAVISETGMTADEFVIGGYIDSNNKVKINEYVTGGTTYYGALRYHDADDYTACTWYTDSQGMPVMLSAQTYTLVVTDVNGKSVKERINMTQQPITMNYTSEGLGVKFYDTQKTPKSYVCQNGFNGTIAIDTVSVDGYQCKLDGTPTSIEYQGVLTVSGLTAKPTSFSSASTTSFDIIFKIGNEAGIPINDALCSSGFTDGVLTFNVYRPSTYSVVLIQMCDSSSGAGKVETDNQTNASIAIPNGKNFHAYLNKMPLDFMIGDRDVQSNANSSYFYATSTAATAVTDTSIKGWRHPEDCDMYKFTPATSQNEEYWSDFLSLNDSISSHKSKRDIIVNKFEWMFSVCNGVFLTSESIGNFVLDAEGGKSPLLYRTVHPDYMESHDDTEVYSNYVNEDSNRVSCGIGMPNIISDNVSRLIYRDKQLPVDVWMNDKGVCFNHLIFGDEDEHGYSTKWVGNYMAAFTSDGGYTSRTGIDSSIRVLADPWLAKVDNNPDNPKQKGRTYKGLMGENDQRIQYVREDGHSYLRCLTVDRRFDYDLIIVGPMLSDFNVNIGDNSWKNARMVGVTYNGIEMAYEASSYCIMSANTTSETTDDGDVDVVRATTLNKYEYTYEYRSGSTEDAKVYLNKTPSTIRRPFEAMVNSVNLLSDVSKYRKVKFSGGTDYQENNGPYPTARVLDVTLPPESQYTFSNIACSYDISPEVADDGVIRCYAEAGETTELNFRFGNIIYFAPDKDTLEFYNLSFNRNSESTYVSGLTFSGPDDCNIRVKVGKPDTDQFEVYVRYPRICPTSTMTSLLNSLNPPVHVDSNGYVYQTPDDNGNYRNISGYSEVSGITYRIYSALSKTIEDNTQEFRDIDFPDGAEAGTVESDDPNLRRDDRPNKYWLGKTFVWDSDSGEFASVNNSKFANTTFGYVSNNPPASTFSVILDEAWFYTDNDGLKRAIRVVDRTEPLDSRGLKLEVVDAECSISDGVTKLTFDLSSSGFSQNQAMTAQKGLRTRAYFHGFPNKEFVVDGTVEGKDSPDATSDTGEHRVRLSYTVNNAANNYDITDETTWCGGNVKGDHKYITLLVISASGFIYALDALCPGPQEPGTSFTLRLK